MRLCASEHTRIENERHNTIENEFRFFYTYEFTNLQVVADTGQHFMFVGFVAQRT
jgi:cytochrome c biogenesis protein ResB